MKNKFLLLSLLLLLFPYFAIGLFSRPCADDFSYSWKIHDYLLNNEFNLFEIIKISLNQVKNTYLNWQGTYSSIFLMTLQPGLISEKYYFIGSAFLIIFIYLAFLYFYQTILNNKAISFVFSLITVLFILGNEPSLVQGLYWYNGAYHYIPFFALSILNISILIKFNFTKKLHFIIISVLLSAIISGGNQVTSFFNILAMVFILIIDIYYKNNKFVILPLLSAIFFFLVMAVAPGNFIRKAAFPNTSLFSTLFYSVFGGYMFAMKWFNLGLLCFIILSLILVNHYKETIINKYNLIVNPIFLFIYYLIVYIGVLCVPYYAMGTFGDLRTRNAIWLIFTFGLIFNVDYAYIYLMKKYDLPFNLNWLDRKKSVICIYMLILLVVIQPNYITLLNDLIKGHAAKYAQTFDKNIKIINSAPKNELIYIEPLPNCATIKFDDIVLDPLDWKNVAFAKYYNIKQVSLNRW